jgi:hypothetical protein
MCITLTFGGLANRIEVFDLDFGDLDRIGNAIKHC